MDSSDEELFEAVPSNISSLMKTTTSTSNKIDSKIKIKDFSIHLRRIEDRPKSAPVMSLRKRRKSLWKRGISKKQIPKKKIKKTSETEDIKRSSSYGKSNEIEPPVDATTSPENEENNCALSNVQHEERLKSNDSQKSSYDKHTFNLSSLLSDETENMENLFLNSADTSARTLPYDWTKKTILDNDKQDAVIYPSVLSSLSSTGENAKQTSFSSKNNDDSPYCLPSNKAKKKRNLPEKDAKKYDKTLDDLLVRAISIRGQLDKWKLKKKRVVCNDDSSDDDSSDDDFPVRTTKRRKYTILSDSSDNENTVLNNSTQMIEDVGQKCPHSSGETMDREQLHTINMCRELQIIVTRLEELDDVNVIRWQESRTCSSKNALRNSLPRCQAENQQSEVFEDEEASTNTGSPDIELRTISHQQVNVVDDIHKRDQRNELNSSDFSTAENTQKAVSKSSSKTSTNHTKKYDPDMLNIALKSCINVWKKFKLFRKPRVMLIRLETLLSPLKDNIYSANEIECLTRKYMESVINSNSVSRKSMVRSLMTLKKQKKVNTSIANTEKSNANISVSPSGVSIVEDIPLINRSLPKKSSSKGTTLSVLFLLLMVVHSNINDLEKR